MNVGTIEVLAQTMMVAIGT